MFAVCRQIKETWGFDKKMKTISQKNPGDFRDTGDRSAIVASG